MGDPVWYFNLQFIQISNNCDERTNVMEMELYGMNKSSGRILSIDIQREKEGKKRAEKRERDVVGARDYLNCRA